MADDDKLFSKDFPSTADAATDHVVEILPDGTMITRDGYILEGFIDWMLVAGWHG